MPPPLAAVQLAALRDRIRKARGPSRGVSHALPPCRAPAPSPRSAVEQDHDGRFRQINADAQAMAPKKADAPRPKPEPKPEPRKIDLRKMDTCGFLKGTAASKAPLEEVEKQRVMQVACRRH